MYKTKQTFIVLSVFIVFMVALAALALHRTAPLGGVDIVQKKEKAQACVTTTAASTSRTSRPAYESSYTYCIRPDYVQISEEK